MTKTVSTAQTKILIALLTITFALSGCFHTNTGESGIESGHEAAPVSSTIDFEPYYPPDFSDLLIPGELVWNREKSEALSTESFKGGILNFSGRVEVTSLMEFFANSMKNDGWTSVGALKSKNVLLAFTKGNNSCMIKIIDGGPIGKTDVNIYIAKTK